MVLCERDILHVWLLYTEAAKAVNWASCTTEESIRIQSVAYIVQHILMYTFNAM